MEITNRTHGSHAATSEGLHCLLGAVRKRHLQLHAHEGWLSKACVGWDIQDAAEDGFKHDLVEDSDGFVPHRSCSLDVLFPPMSETSTCCSCRV